MALGTEALVSHPQLRNKPPKQGEVTGVQDFGLAGEVGGEGYWGAHFSAAVLLYQPFYV